MTNEKLAEELGREGEKTIQVRIDARDMYSIHFSKTGVSLTVSRKNVRSDWVVYQNFMPDEQREYVEGKWVKNIRRFAVGFLQLAGWWQKTDFFESHEIEQPTQVQGITNQVMWGFRKNLFGNYVRLRKEEYNEYYWEMDFDQVIADDKVMARIERLVDRSEKRGSRAVLI